MNYTGTSAIPPRMSPFWPLLLLLHLQILSPCVSASSSSDEPFLFEDDIIPLENQIRAAYGENMVTTLQQRLRHSNRRLGASTIGDDYLWSGGVLFYQFAPELTEAQRNLITLAMNKLHEMTDITFKMGANPRHSFVVFQHGAGGCSSYVGRIGWAEGQPVNLGSEYCWKIGVIMHEILHALGLWHQQSLSTRDKYVKVQLENIREESAFNFKKRLETSEQEMPYDYDSVMHYSAYAASKNGEPTLVAVNPDGSPNQKNTERMGQRLGLSTLDAVELQLMYHCQIYQGLDKVDMSDDRYSVRPLLAMCTADCPCQKGQGHCHSDDQCQGALSCQQTHMFSHHVNYAFPGLFTCEENPKVPPGVRHAQIWDTFCDAAERHCHRRGIRIGH